MEILNSKMTRLAPDNSPYDLSTATATRRDLGKASLWRSLLVLELRGESFAATCNIAARLSLPFYGFNRLPLPGNDGLPPSPDMPDAARQGMYNTKCQPPILEIIARARRLRKNHPLLKSVYIVSDASGPALSEARMWLGSEGWEHVLTGRDDVWQGDEVGEGVDLEVARRAGVFVGNGVS